MGKNFSSVQNPLRQRPTLLEAAQFYLSRGYAPVPMPLASKAPVIKNWTGLRLLPSQLKWRFAGDGNIGLLTGAPSGWLIDIDLDCPEAVELADQFLPHTGAVTGHEKRPRSHRWYFAVGLRSKRFCDPVTRAMIVEIRSTGLLSTVGPSLHPDGGRYDLLEAVPTTVPGFILLDAVRRLWKAVYTQRGHYPPPPRLAGLPSVPEKGLDAYTLDERVRRATRYLRSVPGAVEHQGGHNQTFAAATALVHGFALPGEIAFDLLRDQYNPHCQPPWPEKALRHKVEQAFITPHDMPKGWLLIARPASSSRKDPA